MSAQDRQLILIGVCVGFFLGVLIATGFWFVIVEQVKDIMRPVTFPALESQLIGMLT